MTNAEARFNKCLRPRKPEGWLGRTAQDVHLDSHTAPELCAGTPSVRSNFCTPQFALSTAVRNSHKRQSPKDQLLKHEAKDSLTHCGSPAPPPTLLIVPGLCNNVLYARWDVHSRCGSMVQLCQCVCVCDVDVLMPRSRCIMVEAYCWSAVLTTRHRQVAQQRPS